MTAPRWNSAYAASVREDLVRLVGHDERAAVPGGAPERSVVPGRVRSALVTVVVLALLVVGGIAVLRLTGPGPAAGPGTPTPSPSATPSARAGSIDALPPVRGRLLATWTDATPLPATKTVDARGDAIAITTACTGGGRLRYSVVGRSDSAEGCSGATTGGPMESAKDGRLIAEHSVTVRVSVTGHPRFALRVWAVPVRSVAPPPAAPTVAATGAAVPASLRTCGARDLAPGGAFTRWPHFQGGLVAIRSAATTDCAIRSWPRLDYLDRSGAAIGGPASQLSDESAAPVRLAAHGTAWVEIELFTARTLTNCGAVQVRTVRLRIGAAEVRVPVAATPAVAKCVDPNTQADGVGAVTGYKPTGP